VSLTSGTMEEKRMLTVVFRRNRMCKRYGRHETMKGLGTAARYLTFQIVTGRWDWKWGAGLQNWVMSSEHFHHCLVIRGSICILAELGRLYCQISHESLPWQLERRAEILLGTENCFSRANVPTTMLELGTGLDSSSRGTLTQAPLAPNTPPYS